VSQQDQRSYDGVVEVLIKHLETNLETKPANPVTVETRLVAELNLDSLQSFEMVADLEDHYEISISLDLLQGVETVGGVARIVYNLILAES